MQGLLKAWRSQGGKSVRRTFIRKAQCCSDSPGPIRIDQIIPEAIDPAGRLLPLTADCASRAEAIRATARRRRTKVITNRFSPSSAAVSAGCSEQALDRQPAQHTDLDALERLGSGSSRSRTLPLPSRVTRGGFPQVRRDMHSAPYRARSARSPFVARGWSVFPQAECVPAPPASFRILRPSGIATRCRRLGSRGQCAL